MGSVSVLVVWRDPPSGSCRVCRVEAASEADVSVSLPPLPFLPSLICFGFTLFFWAFFGGEQACFFKGGQVFVGLLSSKSLEEGTYKVLFCTVVTVVAYW